MMSFFSLYSNLLIVMLIEETEHLNMNVPVKACSSVHENKTEA